MPKAPLPGIHRLALLSPEAELADDISIGPYVVLEGEVRIGPGCVLHSQVHLCGPLTLGRDNLVCSGTVLGERPQDLKYAGEPSGLEIGDGNVFREQVTVHRGSSAAGRTRIGNRNVFRAHSHVGHDSRIGDECTLAEGALVGGHCTLGDRVYLGGNCAVHQGKRVGRLARLAGCSITTKDIPPFVRQRGVNQVRGLNESGLRRAGLTDAEIDRVRQALLILFRNGLALPAAVRRIEQELGPDGAVGELLGFLQGCKQGINGVRDHGPAVIEARVAAQRTDFKSRCAMPEVKDFVPEDLVLAQAAELLDLVDLEACWENLRDSPSPRSGTLSLAELHAKQNAHRAFQTKLVAYNQRHTPAHIPELLLNTPVRLGRRCRVIRKLCLRVEPGEAIRCPTHLAAKAYRWADKIARRLGHDAVVRRAPAESVQDVVTDLEHVSRWCEQLEKETASS